MTDPIDPVVSVGPIAIPAPYRGQDLEVRVSAPVAGGRLPVIVFAHGFGSSGDAYAPLAAYWAARGFVVVQPTFLDSRSIALAPDDPRTPDNWRLRVQDMSNALDQLDTLVAAVPGLTGRVDTANVAMAGHSWGAQTTGMLLGARVLDADGTPGDSVADPRVRAGVLLSATGTGGADLSPFAAEHFSFMSPDFSSLAIATLVVAGENDDSPLSSRGPDWFTDAFTLSPGAENLLVLKGGEHMLGGITGYGVTETTDEDPARVAAVQVVTTAWLRARLVGDDAAWQSTAGTVEPSVGAITAKEPSAAATSQPVRETESVR